MWYALQRCIFDFFCFHQNYLSYWTDKLANIDHFDKITEFVPIFKFLFTFLYSGAWAFCDRDDPDAFQLILKSQDGSLVSITPLGNIMWHREEGLASLDVVKLITRDVADGDGNQIIYFSSNFIIAYSIIIFWYICRRVKYKLRL